MTVPDAPVYKLVALVTVPEMLGTLLETPMTIPDAVAIKLVVVTTYLRTTVYGCGEELRGC
jgi:hypothetical protein